MKRKLRAGTLVRVAGRTGVIVSRWGREGWWVRFVGEWTPVAVATDAVEVIDERLG